MFEGWGTFPREGGELVFHRGWGTFPKEGGVLVFHRGWGTFPRGGGELVFEGWGTFQRGGGGELLFHKGTPAGWGEVSERGSNVKWWDDSTAPNVLRGTL